MSDDFLFTVACLCFFVALVIYLIGRAWAMALLSGGLLAMALAFALPIVIK